MHGVVLADADGRPLRPAVLWSDTRSSGQLSAYRSLSDGLLRDLANPVVTGMAGPTLLWLREHEPEAYDAARWALQPKDWLRLRLTGDVATDPTDASATLLWDAPADGWHEAAIDRLGLRRSVFAPVRPSASIAGGLGREAARELGLPQGTPVAAGAADTAAAIHGSGLKHDEVLVTVGSGGQCVHLVDAPRASPERGVHLFRAVDPDRWYRMGAIQNAGLALEWARAVLGMSWDEMYTAFDAVPAGSEGLVFLPYATGERTPHLDPNARAGWLFASLRHGREHFARAALEGVAFAFADAFDALFAGSERPAAARLAGGGSVEPSWRQLLADVLGTTLRPVGHRDASVRGAARLAAEALGEPVGEAFGEARPSPADRVRSSALEPRPASPELTRARTRFQAAYRALASSRGDL